jgi:Cu(I)/Ag(I) efflux system membrane fusion protein
MAMPAMAGATPDSPLPGRASVSLTPAQASAIGVTYATVQRGPLDRTVRVVGTITVPESSQVDVTAKVDGYVDRLYADVTGQAVRRGAPLVTLFSPALVAAEQELVSAARLAASADTADPASTRQARELLDAARRRLGYWDISPAQVARIERTGAITRTLPLAAPVSGLVLEKDVVAGQAVQPGTRLYRLADLSTVWLEGQAFERDLADLRVGAPVRIEVTGYAGPPFAGRVSFVAPVVDPVARTARVRVALRNVDGRLRPGMFATMSLDASLGRDVVHVPADAVIRTGVRDLVFVVGPGGALVPHEVTVGARAGDQLEIRAGLAGGERIVASGNFLVDAESRLAGEGSGMAAMPGMAMPGHDGGHP